MTTHHRPVGSSALPSLIGIGSLTVALHLAGSDTLATPPLTDPARWGRWLEGNDPVTTGFSLARLACLAVAYHLLIALVLATLGGVLRRPGLVRVADHLTLPSLRTPVRRLLGVGLTATAALATPLPRAAGAPGAGVDGGAATMWVASPDPGTATLATVSEPPAEPPPPVGSATMTVVERSVAIDADAQTAGTDDPEDGTDSGSGASTGASTLGETEPAGTHVVQPGDHLWAIAERTVEARQGTVDGAVVECYWRQLVLANPHLADPDLVFPGDVIDLPPVRHTG